MKLRNMFSDSTFFESISYIPRVNFLPLSTPKHRDYVLQVKISPLNLSI